MSKIEQLKNVVIDTGTKLYRESTMLTSTKALYDFRSGWAGAAKNITANGTVKDLCYTNNVATIKGATLTYVGGGLRNAVQNGARIDFPVASAPLFADTNWLVNIWYSPEGYFAGAASDNTIFQIGSFASFDYTKAMCAVRVFSTDGINITKIGFAVRGLYYESTDSATLALFAGATNKTPILMSVHYQLIGGTHYVRIYLNGALFMSRSTTTTVPTITPTSVSAFGTAPNWSLTGKFYRYKLDNLLTSTNSAADIINTEYQTNSSVFS